MAVQECPRCGLINPGSTISCDCGFSFRDGSWGPARNLGRGEAPNPSLRRAQIGIGLALLVIGGVIGYVMFQQGARYGYAMPGTIIATALITLIRGMTRT